MKSVGRILHEIYNKKFSLDLHRSVSHLYIVISMSIAFIWADITMNYASTDGNIFDKTFTWSIGRGERFTLQIE